MKSPLMIKWRYWNNGTAKAGRASNYLNYIATREGVEKLTEEKTYLDYIGTRPRVEKFGENGLFSDEGESLVMDAEREKLNQHQGRVSTLIISLSREDAEATGFNCAERWRSFMRTQKMELARQFGIPPEHLKWYGAFHNEASQPHIHVLLYSTDPQNEGYLTKKGLEHIKSTFATEIFRHELDSIYQAQTKHRDELTKIARDEIAELVMRIQNGTCDNTKLIQMMQELADNRNGSSTVKLSPISRMSKLCTKTKNITTVFSLGWMKTELRNTVTDVPPPAVSSRRKPEVWLNIPSTMTARANGCLYLKLRLICWRSCRSICGEGEPQTEEREQDE